MQEMWVQPLGQEDSLEKEMATHYNILDREIQGTQEPGMLYSPWGHKRGGHDLPVKKKIEQFDIAVQFRLFKKNYLDSNR